MAAAWPAISGIQYDTITVTPLEQRTTFPTDLGVPKTAALASSRRVSITFDMVLTGTELSTFLSWWETDLALGAESFTGLEGVVGDNAAEYKFQSMPAWRVIRGGTAAARLWRATFQLWRVD